MHARTVRPSGFHAVIRKAVRSSVLRGGTVAALCLLAVPLPGAAAREDTGLRFPALDADAPAGSGRLVECLESLPGEVRCGRFRVHEDRQAATGRTLDLAFVLARSLGATRGTATFHLGGPGSSATAQAMGLATLFADLRQSHDLLFLDHRGVGASGSLSCDVPFPGGLASRFEHLFPPDHLRACIRHLGERARLELYSSALAMDDLDELRRWLGVERLDFWAGSYGTREAQVFLRRHPSAVRTLVLDGAAPLSAKPYLDHARSLDEALAHLLAECAADAVCRAAHPDLAADLRRVEELVAAAPPKVELEGEEVRLGVLPVAYALRGLLYRRAEVVPERLRQAAAGDWGPLATDHARRQAWVGAADGDTGYHLSVICAESIDFVTDEDVRRETEGTFLGDRLIEEYREACRIWPHQRLTPEFLEPVRGDVPVLIFSGARDPVTPPELGRRLAATLDGAVHVVVPESGHGTFGPCHLRMMIEFIGAGGPAGIAGCDGEPPLAEPTPP